MTVVRCREFICMNGHVANNTEETYVHGIINDIKYMAEKLIKKDER